MPALLRSELQEFGLRNEELDVEVQEAVIGRLVDPSSKIFARKYGRDHEAIVTALMYLAAARVPEFNRIIRCAGIRRGRPVPGSILWGLSPIIARFIRLCLAR